jgi:hypothetical protein
MEILCAFPRETRVGFMQSISSLTRYSVEESTYKDVETRKPTPGSRL